jgi:uncharacterized protein (DUF2141 family)
MTKLSLISALLAGLLTTSTASAQNIDLTVKLTGVRSSNGNLRAGLYREAESFRKEEKALAIISVPANSGENTLIFNDIPPGRYAIMAYHDENADGRLNLRLGMFPTEGYGLSNTPKVFGPPKFDDSAFNVDAANTQIEIPLTY